MTDTQRAALGAIIAAIIGFAIGAGWQFTSARGYRGELETTRAELDSTRNDLRFSTLEATLGAATIEAHRGNYESARRLMSDFFTRMQSDVDSAPANAQPAFRAMLDERDEMITALSRGSAESPGLLSDMFVSYRSAMGEPVGPIPAPADATPADTGQ